MRPALAIILIRDTTAAIWKWARRGRFRFGRDSEHETIKQTLTRRRKVCDSRSSTAPRGLVALPARYATRTELGRAGFFFVSDDESVLHAEYSPRVPTALIDAKNSFFSPPPRRTLHVANDLFSRAAEDNLFPPSPTRLKTRSTDGRSSTL